MDDLYMYFDAFILNTSVAFSSALQSLKNTSLLAKTDHKTSTFLPLVVIYLYQKTQFYSNKINMYTYLHTKAIIFVKLQNFIYKNFC